MEKKQKNNSIMALIITIFVVFIFMFTGATMLWQKIENFFQNNQATQILGQDKTFRMISSSENEDLEPVIQSYAKSKGYHIDIQYAGTLDIMQNLNNGEAYDAVWLSNSIWMYMLDSNIRTSNSKCTSINPVIFGITKSKAKELGFIGKTVYTKDIVNAISSGKLKFSMSNPTSTNSGASAYLGLLSTLAGNPEVLTKENLEDAALKEKLTKLFSGMERSSGSEEFLEELFLNGDYEAVVTYESSIININKQLEAKGKEPLYAIYPVDGVSISDSPLAFISNNNSNKKEIFTDIQSYILSDEGQKLLQEKGRRTWYGGISNHVDKTIFNPNWGIDATKYISPVKYPNTNVIKLALNLYQVELRKPTHVVFCLDYSGSMSGTGNTQLMNAMDYILTEKAANDFLQFSEKDKIDIIPFGSKVLGVWSTGKGSETTALLKNVHALKPTGTTALYPAAVQALKLLQNEDANKYNLSIVLMTDGEGNEGTYSELAQTYRDVKHQIPIYSIMFGSAKESQLLTIAKLTNSKVFDGKTDLVKAFKEVRGYN
ncbi:MAG: VWA domain-containing protein [Clostridia bacterium]|nr:VWA domain-containing protein [Clostridia bacterium]